MAQEGIINSCRVCRTPNQDGDFECLYAVQVIEEGGVMQSHTWQLTDTGKLYEDTLGLEIDVSTMEHYPQYLCNSCDLQMRLFRKLTLRAQRTLEELAKLYQTNAQKESSVQQQLNFNIDAQVELDNENPIILDEEYLERGMLTELENEQDSIIEALLEDTVHTTTQPENVIDCVDEEQPCTPLTMDAATCTEAAISNGELLPAAEEANEVLNDLQVVALNSSSCMSYDTQEEEHDIMRTITPSSDAKEIEFVSLFDENIKEAPQQPPVLKQESIEFFDEHYLEDTNSSLPINVFERPKVAGACNGGNTKRAYECRACGLEFLRRTDFLQHRKTVHSNKFPCPYCSKLLHTNDALRVHLRLHNGEPAYTCDICQRTFNQKVHYRYHMDRHNNVRNFKCAHCEKAFLSKHDLGVHTRTHTGDRPYECEICGKDFLILQHLKMHRFSHTTKSVECRECKQKFISPSTLHLHQQSIHNSERRFQCEFCVKRFRRKHHLIAHYNVHAKPDSTTNSFDDFAEECEENAADAYQLVEDERHQQQLAVEEDVDAFLEMTEGDQIDGILVVDDEDGNAQAIYGADYVIGVAEESADMAF